jgi:hypothetical protein
MYEKDIYSPISIKNLLKQQCVKGVVKGCQIQSEARSRNTFFEELSAKFDRLLG